MKRLLPTLLVLLLLAFIFINGAASVQGKSFTYDEPDHLRYGQNILAGDSTRFDDSKMPISALNALPQKLAASLPASAFRLWLSDPLTGRWVTLFASVLLAWLVFFWARRLYGLWAGLLALFLYVFDPNLTAHAQLITTDLYAAAAITLAAYALWRFCRSRTWANAAFSALTLGLAQIAKYTGVYLYLLFPLLVLLYDAPHLLRLLRRSKRPKYRLSLLRGLQKSAGFALLVIITNLLIINSAFLWRGSFTSLGDYRFRSALFQQVQNRLVPLAALRLPLPYPYLEGLDWVFHKERTGEGYGRIYLLGQLKESGSGFPGYFLVAYLFKVPLGMQAMALGALILYLKSFSWRRFRRVELFLLAPILFFMLYFNFFFKAQIGIRFILVIFPFLHIFTARLAARGLSSPRSRLLLGALALYLSISVLSYFPQYLAYFNELVPDRRLAYRILADSNLDWGQNQPLLQAYLAAHPAARFEPQQPTAGTVVVSVNDLVGIISPPQRFAWLREHFKPVGTIGYSYLVYAVP